jgi:hypothetical protein
VPLDTEEWPTCHCFLCVLNRLERNHDSVYSGRSSSDHSRPSSQAQSRTRSQPRSAPILRYIREEKARARSLISISRLGPTANDRNVTVPPLRCAAQDRNVAHPIQSGAPPFEPGQPDALKSSRRKQPIQRVRPSRAPLSQLKNRWPSRCNARRPRIQHLYCFSVALKASEGLTEKLRYENGPDRRPKNEPKKPATTNLRMGY